MDILIAMLVVLAPIGLMIGSAALFLSWWRRFHHRMATRGIWRR